MSVVKQIEMTGAHDGAGDAAAMTDSGESFVVDGLIGLNIDNVTDGSAAPITDNSSIVITGTLAEGTENDWDINDVWKIRYFQYRSMISKIFIPSLATFMTVQAAIAYGKILLKDLAEISANAKTGTGALDETTWTSKKEGTLGNGDSITLVDPAEDATLAITANDGTDVTIRLAYGTGAITTTVAELLAFVNDAGIHLRATSSETGTNLVAADTKTTLASGRMRENRCQFVEAADRLSDKAHLFA